MRVFRIVLVRTLRRLGIELQRGVIKFFESDFARIEASHRIFANQSEEAASVFLARLRLVFVSQRLQKGSLLFGREFTNRSP